VYLLLLPTVEPRTAKTVRFGYAAATATAPALDALLRAGVPRLCDGTTSAKCSVIFLRCFFPGAPPVRLSYREQLAVSA
jgi:hypothetical protein